MWLIGSCLCRGIFRNLENTNAEALVQRCSVKKAFLKISQNSQESTYSRISFLIKLQADLTLQKKKKKALSQVFSCKFWEILKTFFYRATLVVASFNDGSFLLKVLPWICDRVLIHLRDEICAASYYYCTLF